MINILEKTYIISKINPYLDNKIKELLKTPKIYYLDLGFKNSLVNNYSDIEYRIDKGQTYENFILKAFLIRNININFWNYKNEYEVDFTHYKNNKLYGFEVKSKLIQAKITTSMKKFIDMKNPEVLFVLNENTDKITKYKNTKIQFTNHLNIFSIIDQL